ncbi:MAG TPA: hypothetical protein VGO00_00220 [Kofleriaceae bacterium]|nr:hypothetical protein [Kofleriaceae bacterium]
MARIIVLYNTDYDSAGGATDESAVEQSARAVAAALDNAELVGLHGRDVFEVLARVRAAKPDLVFNLCESMAGDPHNEPTFAGLLQLFDIPYTGADLATLATCLYKVRTKDILLGRGIPTPPHRYLAHADDLADPSLDRLDYPWFVKLAEQDASVGITEANRVTTATALRARAGELIREHGEPVLAERYVDGREINVTLLGHGDSVEMLPLHEIDFGQMPAERPRIVSYAAKWDEAHVDYAGTKPVPLRNATPAMVAAIERVARAAWEALGLRDYGRVDLRVDAAGAPWVIDVNPNCDISPDAGAARAAAVAGIPYPAFVGRIAELALRRIRTRA